MAVTENVLANANDIMIDLSGNLNYLQDTSLWKYSASDTTELESTVVFNTTDLGVPDVDKLINFVDVDYEGAFTLAMQLDGDTVHTFSFDDVSFLRSTAWQDYPLSKRKGFKKLKMTITASDRYTKIYSIEIDFDVLRRRRYN